MGQTVQEDRHSCLSEPSRRGKPFAWIALLVLCTQIVLPAKATAATLPEGGHSSLPEEIVFAVRQPGVGSHWYENFGYYAQDEHAKVYRAMGRLCRLNLRTGKLTVLVDDAKGSVRDPQVHRAYEDFCAARVQQHIRSTYSDAELAALLDRKSLEIQAQFPSAKLWSPDSLARLAEAALRADITREIPLPTLQQFAASLPQ
jgi:hypothetical protein